MRWALVKVLAMRRLDGVLCQWKRHSHKGGTNMWRVVVTLTKAHATPRQTVSGRAKGADCPSTFLMDFVAPAQLP